MRARNAFERMLLREKRTSEIFKAVLVLHDRISLVILLVKSLIVVVGVKFNPTNEQRAWVYAENSDLLHSSKFLWLLSFSVSDKL